MSFTTQPNLSYLQYWVSVRHVRHAVLRIRACRDAFIWLGDWSGTGYEIALGIVGKSVTVDYTSLIWLCLRAVSQQASCMLRYLVHTAMAYMYTPTSNFVLQATRNQRYARQCPV